MTNAARSRAPSSAGSRASSSATATPTTAASRRRSACRCSATRPRRPTRRATAASTTSTSSGSTRSASSLLPRLLPSWDGGPVTISETLEEGDEIAGFKVIHLPGHAPGMIGLWRESDRVALTSDCFYTLDPQTGLKGKPRVPHAAFNQDTEQARASIRKLAALEPAAALPGPHGPAHRRRPRAARDRCGDDVAEDGWASAPAAASVRRTPRRRCRTRRRPTTPAPGDQVLTLRCVLTAKTREQYAGVLHGNTLSQEDAWQRRRRVPLRAPRGALDDQRRRDRGPAGPAAAAARRDDRRAPLRARRPARALHRMVPRRGGSPMSRRPGSSTDDGARRRRRGARRRPDGRPAGGLLPGRAAASADHRALEHPRDAAAARAAARDPRARRLAVRFDIELPGQSRGFYEHARDLHLDDFDDLAMAEAKGLDAVLGIQAPYDPRELAGVDPARMARVARARRPVRERTLKKRWCSTLWPTPAGAAAAGMELQRLRRVRAARDVPRPARPGPRVGRARHVPGVA